MTLYKTECSIGVSKARTKNVVRKHFIDLKTARTKPYCSHYVFHIHSTITSTPDCFSLLREKSISGEIKFNFKVKRCNYATPHCGTSISLGTQSNQTSPPAFTR
jgi:hypothetical protein